ncbi:AI-2E family transporter [[Phormidium ambiguum] IAM M-71]|uniref:AI-2E family transporter n=1 Tax=[Phormidium ambiguum] IAM M-71 TaxID=454136 RepID=A0A1U7IAY2_9CYAN|nr:AI-2E family transporter [Phormidium ambiguum]OKH33704.1 AI-2E family transporter [Phormidium ambiguum IAM M-71]
MNKDYSIFTPGQKFIITWLLILAASWATLVTIGYVGELVSVFLSAALLAFLFNYPVKVLQRFLPRVLAVALVYLTAIVAIILIGLTVVPPVFNQGVQLVTNLPSLVASGREQLDNFQAWSLERNLPFDVRILASQLLSRIQAQAEVIASKGFGLVVGTFNWFLDFIFILVISFYMLIDGEKVWGTITSVLSPIVGQVLTESLQKNLQKFISGQLLLGLFMAIILTIAFWVLKVPFFLLFAVFIGIMEVIPFVGATLGIGTVVIIVAFIDWWLALEVLGTAIVIQQIKDNLISPRLMGGLTGFSPVILFLALLLGAKFGGLLGVILAIPFTGVAKSIAEIVFDPDLPPQTGSFFSNPFDDNKEPLLVENSAVKKDKI